MASRKNNQDIRWFNWLESQLDLNFVCSELWRERIKSDAVVGVIRALDAYGRSDPRTLRSMFASRVLAIRKLSEDGGI